MREISEREKVGYFKPQINYLPVNLNFDECLKSQKLIGFKNFNKDFCAKLVSDIITVPIFNKKLRYDNTVIERPFYNMSSTEMYRHNKDYKSYLDLLLNVGILETDGHFIKGEKSKGYRLTLEYDGKKCSTYINYKYGKYVYENTSYSSLVDGGHNYSSTVQRLINYLPSVKLDYDKVMVHLDNESEEDINKYNCIFCSLNKISNGDFFAKQDDYGRLHTNLTNLKKEYRNYLTANGEKLVSLDLKNSQPFFSTILTKSEFWEGEDEKERLTFKNLNKSITDKIQNIDNIIMFTKSVEDNGDLIIYRELVLNGTLYEYFLSALKDNGVNCQNRAEAKKSVFEIFFSKTAILNRNKNAKVFKSIFPTIFKLFELIKKSGHNLLALILQCIESKIIIDGIAGNFINKHPITPIYTIHDSVVVPIEKLDAVKEDIVSYTIIKTGYVPSIETEFFEPTNLVN